MFFILGGDFDVDIISVLGCLVGRFRSKDSHDVVVVNVVVVNVVVVNVVVVVVVVNNNS